MSIVSICVCRAVLNTRKDTLFHPMAYPQPVISSKHDDARHDAGHHPSKAVHALSDTQSRLSQSEHAGTGDTALLLKQAQHQLHAIQKSQHQHQQRYPGNSLQMNVSTPSVHEQRADALSQSQSYASPRAHHHSPPHQPHSPRGARSHLHSTQHHSQAHLQSHARATHSAAPSPRSNHNPTGDVQPLAFSYSTIIAHNQLNHVQTHQAHDATRVHQATSNQQASSPGYSASRLHRTHDQPQKDPYHPSPPSHHSAHHHLYATQDKTQNGTLYTLYPSPQSQHGAHQLHKTQDQAFTPAHDATPRSHPSALHQSHRNAAPNHLPYKYSPQLHRGPGNAHAAKGEDASISARCEHGRPTPDGTSFPLLAPVRSVVSEASLSCGTSR